MLPSLINCGNCDDFANEVAEQFTEAEAYWGIDIVEEFPNNLKDDADGHCFIEYKGKYYDAEAPEGVNHVTQLPFYLQLAKWIEEKA